MPGTRGNLDVVLEGRGPVTIRDSNHVATGGEGSIYKVAGTSIKIYTDPQKMQHDGMVDKLKLLVAIKHPSIVAPNGLVLDNSGRPLGFYMPFVDGEPMPRVFTNDFRVKEKFGDEQAKILVDRMRETVNCAHAFKAVMVDANELNWLVLVKEANGPFPRIIDVDSWAISRWPAKVIMPSIKDWRSKVFDEKTDWFAWGIVTFQVFTGIHPYKGTLDGFARGDLEGRMKANASVFTKGVRLNLAVRNFSCIPGLLRDWYYATFEKGERNVPPSPFDTGISIAPAAKTTRLVVTATGALVYEKIHSGVGDPVIRIWPCGVVMCSSGKLIDLSIKREIASFKSRDVEVVRISDGWLIGERINGKIKFYFVRQNNLKIEELEFLLQGSHLLRYENRLFLVDDRGLTELVVNNFGKIILSAGKTWGAMPNATKWFDGVGVQDALGAMYLIAPFGDDACAHVRVRELDGLRAVSAKSGPRFISIIVLAKDGFYHKLELTFDRNYNTYTLWRCLCDGPELNAAILPKGVCATIVDDGELVIFVPTSGVIKKIKDKQVTTDIILANWDDQVVYIQNGDIWRMRLK